MKSIKHIASALLMVCIAHPVAGQDGTESDFRKWALTPPLGWNSWDCYYSTVTEDIVMQNADYQQKNLLEYGWEYVVIDIRWYANHPSLGGGWYNQVKTPECQLDEYGRYVPSPTRFPSAMQKGRNEGFKALADAIHERGMKFGIHIMRGMPKYILDNPGAYKLKGAEDADWSLVYKDTQPECAWLQDNLTVQDNQYGQLYYNSIIELYASWGVDFIKVDDMSRPYYDKEIAMLRKAIDQCGRPIVLSLSPGKTGYQYIDHLHGHANMWRMMDDLWDRWNDVKAVFAEADAWQPHHQAGNYADCDMLPLGQISMTVDDPGFANADNGRYTNLTHDEQYTLMTLWGICHSPLFFGGEMTKNDEFTHSLLTNRDYLRMHAYGMDAHQVSNEKGKIVWTSVDPKSGERYLALFFTDAGNGWIYDDHAIYASETVAYTTDGHKVDVDIRLPDGTKELALVVDDAGDGFNYDHGDWINPVFVSKNGYEVPVTGEFVKEKYTNSYYNTINENTNVLNNGKMRVLGKEYERGFSMDANALLLFNVPDSIVGFRGMGALDDSGIGQPNSTTSIKFYVFNFDPRLTSGTPKGSAQVSCDLSQFGYEKDTNLEIFDVWSGESLGTFKPGTLTQEVNSHGVKLLRIVPERSRESGITLKVSPTADVQGYDITAKVSGPVDGQSFVQFFIDGQFAGTQKVRPETEEVVYHAGKLANGSHRVKAYFSGSATSAPSEAELTIKATGPSASKATQSRPAKAKKSKRRR